MSNKIERLKQRRAQLTAQIQNAEAKEKQRNRKDETRLKILVGAAILAKVDRTKLLNLLEGYYTRENDLKLIFGEDGKGSELFAALSKKTAPKTPPQPAQGAE